MNFEFKENHRNINDDELIEDVKRVAVLINSNELTTAQYNKLGKFNSSTLCRRFGNWINVLNKAELNIKKEQRYKIDKNELIKDIKLVANKLNSNSITSSQYKLYGTYDIKPILRTFGSWANALRESELEPTGFNFEITDLDLFNDIQKMWILKGTQPTSSDVKKGYLNMD